jgi:hypothetical protein
MKNNYTYNYLLTEKENFEEAIERLEALFDITDDSEDLNSAKRLYLSYKNRINSIEQCLTSMTNEAP